MAAGARGVRAIRRSARNGRIRVRRGEARRLAVSRRWRSVWHGALRDLAGRDAAGAAGIARPAMAGDARGAHAFALHLDRGRAPAAGAALRAGRCWWSTRPRCAASPTSTRPCSGCGTRYRDRGLVVLGVPSNDFGGQEPGSADRDQDLLRGQLRGRLPADREGARQGRRGRTRCSPGCASELGADAGPRWNFHKYLIAPDGRVVAAWPSSVEPDAPADHGGGGASCWRRRR